MNLTMNPRGMTSRRLLVPLILAVAVAWAGCSDEKAVKPPTWGMVQIKSGKDSFYIDRFEFPNKLGERPYKMIVFAKARQMCAKAGKRLCTDWEWRRACLGPDMRNIFGYGPRHEEGRCYSGNKLESGHSGMTMEEGAVSPSGREKGCRTPEGVQDMVGNLEEWVLSSWNGSPGMLEGGAWFTIARYASCTGDYSRQPHYRTNLEVPIYSAGFRCCWSPDAPTESELTREQLARDTTLRLAAARKQASGARYDPNQEVELAPGTFIDKFEYPNRKGEKPRVGVSWEQANADCKAAGKRLCHVEEWERACGGPKALNYPYGDKYKPGFCSVEASGPAKSGAYSFCVSPTGVNDMSGGTWEWTADEMEAPAEIYGVNQTLRHVRGGSWFVDPLDGTCRPELGYPTAHQKAVYTDVGFRCCRGEKYTPKLVPTGGTARCPEDMVAIKEFCVDRYEFPNLKDEPPLHDLNFTEATTACSSVGLHVCTEREWTLACAGTDRRPWPYGFSYEAKTCHYGLLPNDENYVVVSGTMPQCKTPEGIYDLSGNVWEWTVSGRGGGELRGGGANISAGYGRCNSRARARANFSTFETGVRCCGTQGEVNEMMSRGGRPTLKQTINALQSILNRKKNAPMQDRFEDGAPSDPPVTEPSDVGADPDVEGQERGAMDPDPSYPPALKKTGQASFSPPINKQEETRQPPARERPEFPDPAGKHAYKADVEEVPITGGEDRPSYRPTAPTIQNQGREQPAGQGGKEQPVIAASPARPSYSPPTTRGEEQQRNSNRPRRPEPPEEPALPDPAGKHGYRPTEPPRLGEGDKPSWSPPTQPRVVKNSATQAPVLPDPSGKHGYQGKEPPVIATGDKPSWAPQTGTASPVVVSPWGKDPPVIASEGSPYWSPPTQAELNRAAASVERPTFPDPAGKHGYRVKDPPVTASEGKPSWSPPTQPRVRLKEAKREELLLPDPSGKHGFRGKEPPVIASEGKPSWSPPTRPRVEKKGATTAPVYPDPSGKHGFRGKEPPVLATGGKPSWAPSTRAEEVNKVARKGPALPNPAGQHAYSPGNLPVITSRPSRPSYAPAKLRRRASPTHEPGKDPWADVPVVSGTHKYKVKELPVIAGKDKPSWAPPRGTTIVTPAEEAWGINPPVMARETSFYIITPGKEPTVVASGPSVANRAPPTERRRLMPTRQPEKSPWKEVPVIKGEHAYKAKEPPVTGGEASRPSYSPPVARRRVMPQRKEYKNPWKGPPVIRAEPRGPGAPPPLPPQADPKKRANVKVCSLQRPACPEGLICCFMNGLCCLAPLECKTSGECPDGELCYTPHQRCYLKCDGRFMCKPPFTCDPVMKVCRPPGATCSHTDECPDGMKCHPHYYYCYK